MRSSRTTRTTRAALGLVASLFLLAPSAAFAQYLKYEATGHLTQFNNVLDAGTTADLAAAGIVPGAAGVGTPVTTTTILLAAEPDGDADPNVGLYETIFMSMDIGDGTMQADRFQRDANVNVAIGFLDTEVFPLALDLFGWTGSEPARQTMPAGFAYNGTAPSAPGPETARDMPWALQHSPRPRHCRTTHCRPRSRSPTSPWCRCTSTSST